MTIPPPLSASLIIIVGSFCRLVNALRSSNVILYFFSVGKLDNGKFLVRVMNSSKAAFLPFEG